MYGSLHGVEALPIDQLVAAPLPTGPQLASLEDALIAIVCDEGQHEHFQWLDADFIVRLHKRFRVLPNTIAADELAVLNATFCVARLRQIESESTSQSPFQLSTSTAFRHDLTYFQMALQLVSTCRPSVHCICELGLHPYIAYLTVRDFTLFTPVHVCCWQLQRHQASHSNDGITGEGIGLESHSDLIALFR